MFGKVLHKSSDIAFSFRVFFDCLKKIIMLRDFFDVIFF